MRLISLALATALIAATASAEDIRTEAVHFDAGATGSTISDSIKGYDSVSYVLGAGEGQNMMVSMEVDNLSAYFNVYEPGKGPGDEAMYVGSNEGNRFEGTLPADGDYTISVYLYRNAARRDEVANYTLDIGIDE